MTLKIRELVIHAEIGEGSRKAEFRTGQVTSAQSDTAPVTGSMTRRFYEEDSGKQNER